MKKPFIFIFREKINFILQLFLEILKRHCKFVILDTLGMTGYTCPKWYRQLEENIYVYQQAKNQLHPSCFSGDIANTYSFLFWVLWECLAMHTQNDSITYRKLQHLSACLKYTSSCTSFLRYYILKNPSIWLANTAFWPITPESEFYQMWNW